MKKFWLLTLWIILVAWTLAGCDNNKETETDNTSDFIIEETTPENEDVISYNDNLVGYASNCIISENGIWNVYDSEDYSVDDVKSAIEDTISICSTAKEMINNLWDWEWDSSLKDWTITIIDKEIEYVKKLGESLPYLDKENLDEEENEAYESIIAEVQALNDELLKANDDIIEIQNNFANNHGFELESVDTADEEVDEEIAE